MSFPTPLAKGLCGVFSCGDCAPLGITEFGANAAQGMGNVYIFALLLGVQVRCIRTYSGTSPVLLIAWN